MEKPVELLIIDDVIRRCVSDGLDCLGESGKMASLYIIESKFGVRMQDVPDNPERFLTSLRTLFGPGAHILVRSILDHIHAAKCESKDVQLKVDRFTRILQDGLQSLEHGIM